MGKQRRPDKREARWTEIMNAYRRRHRRWVMEVMPTMSEAHWQEYEAWVASFGAETIKQPGVHKRKVHRELTRAKSTPAVLRMDRAGAPTTKVDLHRRMRFAMDVDWENHYAMNYRDALAREGLTAKVTRRATRR